MQKPMTDDEKFDALDKSFTLINELNDLIATLTEADMTHQFHETKHTLKLIKQKCDELDNVYSDLMN